MMKKKIIYKMEFYTFVIEMAVVNFSEDKFFTEATLCLPQDHLLEVQNQGETNTCYAYVVTNVIYSDLKENLNTSARGSEQEFLDCLHLSFPRWNHIEIIPRPRQGYGNTYPSALKYVNSKGLCLLEDYPWKECCEECARETIVDKRVVFIGGYRKVESIDQVFEILKKKVAVTGAVILTPTLMQWSGTGIYAFSENNKKKKATKDEKKLSIVRHGITLIGFGETEDRKYFIAQNSWTTAWGYHGYFKVDVDSVDNFYCVEQSWIKEPRGGSSIKDVEVGKKRRRQTQAGTSKSKKQKHHRNTNH